MDRDRQLLRHFLAAIAYRTQKALRDAPDHYAEWQLALLRRVADASVAPENFIYAHVDGER